MEWIYSMYWLLAASEAKFALWVPGRRVDNMGGGKSPPGGRCSNSCSYWHLCRILRFPYSSVVVYWLRIIWKIELFNWFDIEEVYKWQDKLTWVTYKIKVNTMFGRQFLAHILSMLFGVCLLFVWSLLECMYLYLLYKNLAYLKVIFWSFAILILSYTILLLVP